jgi:hypothetical protein
MVYRIEWIDPDKRILLQEYTGSVSIDEVSEVVSKVLAELEGGPIYFVVQTKGARLPVNLIAVRKLPELVRHPNAKHLAVIQDTTFMQYILQLMGQGKASGHKTYEEALAKIESLIEEKA